MNTARTCLRCHAALDVDAVKIQTATGKTGLLCPKCAERPAPGLKCCGTFGQVPESAIKTETAAEWMAGQIAMRDTYVKRHGEPQAVGHQPKAAPIPRYLSDTPDRTRNAIERYQRSKQADRKAAAKKCEALLARLNQASATAESYRKSQAGEQTPRLAAAKAFFTIDGHKFVGPA